MTLSSAKQEFEEIIKNFFSVIASENKRPWSDSDLIETQYPFINFPSSCCDPSCDVILIILEKKFPRLFSKTTTYISAHTNQIRGQHVWLEYNSDTENLYVDPSLSQFPKYSKDKHVQDFDNLAEDYPWLVTKSKKYFPEKFTNNKLFISQKFGHWLDKTWLGKFTYETKNSP